jgi:hypothetical protein
MQSIDNRGDDMETKEALKANEVKQPTAQNDEYRENIKKVIDNEVKKAIDLEIQQAAKELIEEHKKATRQIIDEYRSIINQIVAEEKEAIAAKADQLKRSILKLGL